MSIMAGSVTANGEHKAGGRFVEIISFLTSTKQRESKLDEGQAVYSLSLPTVLLDLAGLKLLKHC